MAERAYYHLDEGDWRGCCYPALLSTGTTVLTKKDIEENDVKVKQNRIRRDTHDMPNHYKGYKTVSPWTKPWENVGWSFAGIFTGLGTTTALNKMNGLAWKVLSLENDTAVALDLITEELKKMREAVIQNRLFLDLLSSSQGGVCKMFGVSCCFHIPDNSDNVTDIVEHMKQSIPEPERVDSWFIWLDNLWGRWGAWILHTVIPVGVLILVLLLIMPCVMQCISGLVSRSLTSLIIRDTYQVMMNVQRAQTFVPAVIQSEQQEQGLVIEHVSNTDTYDEEDYVNTYELEPEEHVESVV